MTCRDLVDETARLRSEAATLKWERDAARASAAELAAAGREALSRIAMLDGAAPRLVRAVQGYEATKGGGS